MNLSPTHRLAGLSLVASEVGLGSVLHGLKIPFAGHLLAINQALLLTLVAKDSGANENIVSNINSVSLFAAFAKAWSPAGKKLTPMLAISVQGLLYSVGISVGGVNFFGITLACSLSAIWSVIQPIALAYILFGKSFLESLWHGANAVAIQFSIPESWLLSTILILMVLKVATTILLGLTVWSSNLGEKKYRWFLSELKARAPKRLISIDRTKSIWINSIQSLSNRWFLLSLIVSLIFFGLSGNYDASGVWKFILRPIVTLFSMGILIEYGVRRIVKASPFQYH